MHLITIHVVYTVCHWLHVITFTTLSSGPPSRYYISRDHASVQAPASSKEPCKCQLHGMCHLPITDLHVTTNLWSRYDYHWLCDYLLCWSSACIIWYMYCRYANLLDDCKTILEWAWVQMLYCELLSMKSYLFTWFKLNWNRLYMLIPDLAVDEKHLFTCTSQKISSDLFLQSFLYLNALCVSLHCRAYFAFSLQQYPCRRESMSKELEHRSGLCDSVTISLHLLMFFMKFWIKT